MNIKKKLNEYLDLYLKPVERGTLFRSSKMMGASAGTYVDMECAESSIINYINENKDEDTFQTKLFKLIDERELKDSDLYNKVDIDRRLFSKIRSNKDYHPSKETVILLGLGLEVSEKEIEDLLESASYSLPMNTIFDLIVRFCFKEHIYDVGTVNEFLYDHGCRLLNE